MEAKCMKAKRSRSIKFCAKKALNMDKALLSAAGVQATRDQAVKTVTS